VQPIARLLSSSLRGSRPCDMTGELIRVRSGSTVSISTSARSVIKQYVLVMSIAVKQVGTNRD
jgi:hypothetical protein